jgi:cell wall-associated NlpC family hydrolase
MMTDSAATPTRRLRAHRRPHRTAAGRQPRILAVAAGLTLLASPAALVACANPGTGSAAATAASSAAVKLAPCAAAASTCWVSVNVATVWVDPSFPRPVDQRSLGNPPDVPGWIAAMTVSQKRWLEGRLETQAPYGTKVTVTGHDGTTWTKVAIPSQPTNRDPRGYPGWIPTRQLTGTAPGHAAKTALIRWRAAWLWSSWGIAGVTGTRVVQVSYGTRLPVADATPGASYVLVTMLDGRKLALPRQVLSLHTEGTTWGATRAKVVAEARKFLGLPYLWAGTSGFGFDCSGFTYSVYRTFGISLPRDADRQAVHGTPVSAAGLLPGDLVFFRGSATGPIIHVGMYVGGGDMIDAPHTGAGVRVESVWSFGGYAGARRYLSR